MNLFCSYSNFGAIRQCLIVYSAEINRILWYTNDFNSISHSGYNNVFADSAGTTSWLRVSQFVCAGDDENIFENFNSVIWWLSSIAWLTHLPTSSFSFQVIINVRCIRCPIQGETGQLDMLQRPNSNVHNTCLYSQRFFWKKKHYQLKSICLPLGQQTLSTIHFKWTRC